MIESQHSYAEGKKPDLKKYTLLLPFIENSRTFEIVVTKNKAVISKDGGGILRVGLQRVVRKLG